MWVTVLMCLSLLVQFAEIVFIVLLWIDDHKMLSVSMESLAAQKEYLELRRKWYAQRMKKKEEPKPDDIRPA